MKRKVFMIVLSVLSSIVAFSQEADVWLYDTKAKTITDSGGWVIQVSSFTDLKNGTREIAVGKPSVFGTSGTLDFRKQIVWSTEEKFTKVEIVNFVKDAFYANTTSVTNLYLPETVRTLSEYCFRGLTTATVIEPFVPGSVTTFHAPFPNINAFRGDLVLGGAGKDLKMTGGAGSIKATAVMSITFGTGNITVPYQFFWGCKSCTNITFLGENTRWNGESFASWNNYQCLIRVPLASNWWRNYIATNTTFVSWENMTAANQNTYWEKFDPERAASAPLGALKLGWGQAPSMQYIAAFSKPTSTRDLTVDGYPYAIGEVVPAYNRFPEEHIDISPTTCSAPKNAIKDGVYYSCKGYVLETLGASGWEGAVTNLGVNSFVFNPVVGKQRITWLWDAIGYKVIGNTEFIDGFELGTVTASDCDYPGGYYAKDSYVEITATAAGEGAPFVRWCGVDVPTGCEYENPIRIKADAVKTIYPYFKTNWIYSSGTISDGYWKFQVSSSGKSLGLGKSQATLSNSTVWNGGLLDLAKGVEGGYFIKSVVKDFCYGSNPGVTLTIRELTLPDTLTTLNEFSFKGCKNLFSVTPFLPESVTYYNSAFDEASLITNAFSFGTWNSDALTLAGTETFKRLQKVPSFTFGRGLKSLPLQSFYNSSTMQDLYFMGDVLDDDFGKTFQSCGTYCKRIFAPRGNSTWNDFLATNVTAWESLSDSDRNQYNSRWPDGPKPLGLGNIGGGTKMWFLKWTPHKSGSVIILR